MRALLLLCFLVALVAGQTSELLVFRVCSLSLPNVFPLVPAVYYKLYYINRDDQNGINRIETVGASFFSLFSLLLFLFSPRLLADVARAHPFRALD